MRTCRSKPLIPSSSLSCLVRVVLFVSLRHTKADSASCAPLLVWYIEYPRVRVFALVPRVVRMRLAIEAGVGVAALLVTTRLSGVSVD
jgi:hypothetical protein